jgi:diguanylate cyclase
MAGTLLLNILFAGTAALVGAVAGWLLRAATFPDLHDDRDSASDAVEAQQSPTADITVVESALANLHHLTEGVAADVDEHNDRVNQINSKLTDTTVDQAEVASIVDELAEANEDIQSQLVDAGEQLQEQTLEMEKHLNEGLLDTLTRLCNRTVFDDELAKLETASKEQNQTSCVMMIDIDHFHDFNDTYDYSAGDEVLRGVARVLRKNLLSKQVVCRYGGDEFAVLFPDSDVLAAIPTAERARAAISKEVFRFEGQELEVTVCCGLSQLDGGKTGKEVTKLANDALYSGKESGRNCGFWHDGESTHLMTIEEEAAAPSEEFTVAVSEPAEDRRDQITGVSTREAFLKDVDRHVAEHLRDGSAVSILLVEIDDFEELQATTDARTSQLVLRATAQFLKATMRSMDNVGRFGDHHFALLLPGARISDTNAIAERLRTAVSNADLPVNGSSLKYTVSLGGAEVFGVKDRAEFVERAQNSLKSARDAGGNQTFATTNENDCQPMPVAV